MTLLFINIGKLEFIFLFILLIPFVYTLYHAISNKNLSMFEKSLWILVILFGNFIGWIIYWAVNFKNISKKNPM